MLRKKEIWMAKSLLYWINSGTHIVGVCLLCIYNIYMYTHKNYTLYLSPSLSLKNTHEHNMYIQICLDKYIIYQCVCVCVYGFRVYI